MAAPSEAAIRRAFAGQAERCAELGSPFTARLCEAIGPGLDRDTTIGRRILHWAGNPDWLNDSVPLRLAGGLHALVRRGRLPDLARLYPPNPLPEPGPLWDAVRAALEETGDELQGWLDNPPQTNEVARAGVLMAGLAVIAHETRRPLALLELGASAGLNLLLDRYAIRLGTRVFGDENSPVKIEPQWHGADPPAADVSVQSRRGVDQNPLDVSAETDRERLVAYVWADQTERLQRAEAALSVAASDPPRVDRGDAAEWLEHHLPARVEPPAMRIVLHSIAFQYFPRETQDRIERLMSEQGSAASTENPLAWLRYEAEGEEGATLRLRLGRTAPTACWRGSTRMHAL